MDDVPPINLKNLKIARENMGLTSRAASNKISSSKRDLVAEWESGEKLPTWIHLGKLAKTYNIPELLFFTEKVIEKNKVVPDYRVGVDPESDENVKKLINMVETRQRWLEKSLKDAGWAKNQLIGSGRNLRSPKELARFIGEKLSIDIAEIKDISGRVDDEGYSRTKKKHGIICELHILHKGDPRAKKYLEQTARFKSDSNLAGRYDKLKMSLNGATSSVYKAEKAKFFEENGL